MRGDVLQEPGLEDELADAEDEEAELETYRDEERDELALR